MVTQPPKPTFSIIIVTWNALEYLKRFLPSVAETRHESYEIILADNASGDGSAEWVEQNYPQCRIVRMDRNFGYCGGNNRAAETARGDILIFLNNDAETEPGWLQPLENSFEDPETGIVQPKIRSVKQPDQFEYAGAAGGFIDRMGYPFCRGRIFDHVEMDHGQYDQPGPIFWASGAALAVRKKLFHQLGGFDESFEFHMEEIDLCWRCHKLGYRVMYQPESVVYHLGGGSLPMGNPRKVFFNYRNNLIMLTKNLDRNLFPVIFGRLILDGIAGIQSLLTGRPAATLAIIKAHFSYYAHLRQTLIERKTLKKRFRKQSPKALIYHRLVIIDFFLKGKKKFSELTFCTPDNS